MARQIRETKRHQLAENAQTKVVAAIPCFNAGRFIRDIVATARGYVDQVIVVDDGSYDNTTEEARAVGASVVSHDVNGGYGQAIKSCFEAAKANAADVLVIVDGDNQHNPQEIPRLVAPILQGEADLVIGSRFISAQHDMPKYRRFGISVITFLWNLGSKTKVSDTQSGFRAYGKEIFREFSLSEKGMSISIEIIERARRKGAVIKEVPISCLYHYSPFGLGSIKHGIGVALSVVRIRLKSSLLADKKQR